MCAHMSKRPCVPTLPACSSFFVCFDSDAPQSKALAKPDLLAPPPPTDALEGTDYVSFCSAQRLPKTLVDMSLYALIGMPAQQEGGVSETGVHRGALTLSARAGVKAVCKHLRSLNVYGPTAFLASCYGSAELAQGFCRLCAVWGGVYMLRRGAYAGAYPSLTPPSPLTPSPGGNLHSGARSGMQLVAHLTAVPPCLLYYPDHPTLPSFVSYPNHSSPPRFSPQFTPNQAQSTPN